MNSNARIDDLDRKILSIITKNARTPFLDVARECGISGAAVHQRVQKLVNMGIIKGSHFVIDPAMIGYHTCSYIGVYLDNSGLSGKVADELRKIMEIVECHYITGNYSMLIKVFAKNNEHLKQVLSDKIQTIPGVSRTETFISLEALIDRQIPII